MEIIDVSVIVPVYNVEKYLKKCLDSLINQDFDNYEIIVVNDGSPDNSQKIIDKYVKKYPNIIRGFVKENGGVASARNYGIDKSRGEYITFVDSDDCVEIDFLKILYNKANESNSDIVICDVYKISNSKKTILNGLVNETNNQKRNAILSIPAVWNKLFKRSLFIDNKILFPICSYGEDLATTGRIILNAKSIDYVDKPLYNYFDRDGSYMNQKRFNKKMMDIFKSMEVLISYYKSNNFYDNYNKELEYLFISHLLHDYALRVYRYNEGKEEIKKIIEVMNDNFNNWHKNCYYRKKKIKYKIVCFFIYHNYIHLLRLFLK